MQSFTSRAWLLPIFSRLLDTQGEFYTVAAISYGSIFVTGGSTPAVPKSADENAFLARISQAIAKVRERAEGGWTWQELGQQLDDFASLAVDLYRSVGNMTGEQKKAAVMQHATLLIDTVVMPNLPLPGWLMLVLGVIGGKQVIRDILVSVADGMIESAYSLLTRKEVPEVDVS